MKISVCNLWRLLIVIKAFAIFHLKKPYIFMNQSTIKFLEDITPMDFYYKKESEKKNWIVTYKGCLLYPNEELEFGEVEIR